MTATARCFVAVTPPPDLVEALQAMERPDRAGLRWTRPDQWHVTLRFFAAVEVDALAASLAGLSCPYPVTARAGPAPSALSRQVWALPVAGLERLAAAVADVTAGLGALEGRAFKGHLTLARARRPGSPSLEGLPSPPLSARWAVEEVTAFRSELLPGGARHHVIGRWTLGPG